MYKAFVINLKKRTDRWSKISAHYNDKTKLIQLERFEALEGIPPWKYCALSHIALVKRAKEENMPYIIVMEDDNIIVDKNFDEIFPKIMTVLSTKNDWDVFNGSPSTCSEKNKQTISIYNETPRLINYEYGKATNFVIYNNSSYDKVLALEEKYNSIDSTNNYAVNAYDEYLCHINLKLITYVPYIFNQFIDYSDIAQKRQVNQRWIIRSGQKYFERKLESVDKPIINKKKIMARSTVKKVIVKPTIKKTKAKFVKKIKNKKK